MLRWLRSRDPPCPLNEWACTGAAEAGKVSVLKFLKEEGCPWLEATITRAAAEHGHLHVVKWARLEGGCPWDEMTCWAASQAGHKDVLVWARDQDPPCPWFRSECIAGAIAGGHKDVADWISSADP